MNIINLKFNTQILYINNIRNKDRYNKHGTRYSI